MKSTFKGSNSPKVRPKIRPKLAVNTITSYFKLSVPLKQEPTPSPTTPPSSIYPHLICPRKSKSKSSDLHSSSSQESPVSRAPPKMSRKLTPVKLYTTFAFDFPKIPPASISTPNDSNSNSLTSTPTFHPTTPSINANISSPPTCDLDLKNESDLLYDVKTPTLVSGQSSVGVKRFSHCKLSSSSSRRSSCSVDDDIIDISDATKSSCKDDDESQRRRTTKCRVGKYDTICIDCSSDSDIDETPPTRKVCFIDLTDRETEKTTSDTEVTNTCPALGFNDETVEQTVKEPMTNCVPPTNMNISNCKNGVSEQRPSSCGVELDGPSKERPLYSFQAEVKSLLQKRGLSCRKSKGVEKVCLMNSVQNNATESLLNKDCCSLSNNIFSLTECLSNITSIRTMPLGEYLAQLIIIISNEQSLIYNEVSAACLCYLKQLLLLHPPGQHPLIDSQYKSLFTTLQGIGESFWEFLDTLYRGSECCIRLHSFIIDLFLLNYWSTLENRSCQPPLFLDVFWTSKESCSLTTPITKLLERTCETLNNFHSSEENVTKLDNLTTLIYLCGTRCQDLSAQLLLECKKLSSAEVTLLLGYLHSSSLHSCITEGLPDIEKMLRKSEQIFLAMTVQCTIQSGEMENETTPSGPSDLLKASTIYPCQPCPAVVSTQINSVQPLLEQLNFSEPPTTVTIRKKQQGVFNHIKRPSMTSAKVKPSDILKESTTSSSQPCHILTVAPAKSGVSKPTKATLTSHNLSKRPIAIVRKKKQDEVVGFNDIKRPCISSTKGRFSGILKKPVICSSHSCPTVAPTQTNSVQPLLEKSKPSITTPSSYNLSKPTIVRKRKEDAVKGPSGVSNHIKQPCMASTKTTPSDFLKESTTGMPSTQPCPKVTVAPTQRNSVQSWLNLSAVLKSSRFTPTAHDSTKLPITISVREIPAINGSGSNSYGEINRDTKIVKGTKNKTLPLVSSKNIRVSQNPSVLGGSRQTISEVNPLSNTLFGATIPSQSQQIPVHSQDQLSGDVQNLNFKTHSKGNISARSKMQVINPYHKHITAISSNALKKVCENCRKGTCLRCVKSKT